MDSNSQAIVAVSPVGDKVAMKMRYERMIEMDEEIEEENIVKEQFVISDDVCSRE